MAILTTERLLLTKLTYDHANFILELLNEPAFHEFIGDRGIRTIDGALNYIKSGPMESYKNHGFGLYLIQLKEDRIPIGICGIKKRDSMELPELGYALRKKFWSNGYATEAGRGVINYAQSELGLSQLAAITSPDNEASVHVLKKLDFEYQQLIELDDFESASKLFLLSL